jgi:uncharacterized protein (TIGR00661 family)
LNFVENKGKKIKIFVAPLDWGLGHATRCIPIIKTLLQQGVEVVIGATDKIAQLLHSEFPDITIIPLQGYGIKYTKQSRFFMLFMIFQLPKILYSIWKENQQIKKIVVDYQIDAIISDNRLGCFHRGLPSVFITHQLQIITGFKWLDFLALKANYFFINKFDECWVPDFEVENNIAGQLSHPNKLPDVPVKYLGLLSRFVLAELPQKNALTLLVSGPEPQRSIFEKLLVKQTEALQLPALLIRGLPDNNEPLSTSNKNLVQYNHVNAKDLSLILQESEMIIARTGYSTVMDLITLQKKAILIPTPGQTEQEYLAKKLIERRLFFTVSQQDFELKKNIEYAKDFRFQKETLNSSLSEVIDIWVSGLGVK